MKRSVLVTWDQLRVGVLILAALGILGYATVRLGQSARLFTRHYTLVTVLPNANGLRVGGSVSLAGQPAGTVTRIDFLPLDEDPSRNIVVILEIDHDLSDLIRSDSRARLRTLGLLGDKTVDISPGTPAALALNPGDTLVASETVDYEELLLQAAAAVDDVVGLTSDLRTIAAGLVRGEGTLGMLLRDRRLYDDLRTALAGSHTLLQRLQSSEGTFGRLVDDPALYEELLHAAGSVDTLARRFLSDQGTIGRLLADTAVYATLHNTLRGADTLLRSLNSGRGTAGRLLRDEVLYDQMLRSVTELLAILEDFRRNPSRYTRGIIRIF